MYREKITDLKRWMSKAVRKPLIINGARQVGKSWLIENFGNEYFTDGILTLNLEKRTDLHLVFQKNLDVKRIVSELELLFEVDLQSGNKLLFMDEIQNCPEAISSLRYFYEENQHIPVIAAGSLLDFEFRNQPFPVGRVEVMEMHPMTFYEFLMARKKEQLAELIMREPEELSEVIENLLETELNNYFVVGGMPDCVKTFVETQNYNDVLTIQNNLLYAYEQDFKKYQPVVNSDCLNDILTKSTQQLGSQTLYSKLSDRFSGPTIKKGVDVLCTANLLQKVNNVSVTGLPLAISGKQFKLFYLDIGLLLRKSRLNFKEEFIRKDLTASFDGMLSEQFVAQQLVATSPDELTYWARTEAGTNSEIDFVLAKEGQIIPIEVKAGKGGSLKSLHYLLAKFPNVSEAVVFSKSKLGQTGKIRFVPIYYTAFNVL